jgi:hypothetical protein
MFARKSKSSDPVCDEKSGSGRRISYEPDEANNKGNAVAVSIIVCRLSITAIPIQYNTIKYESNANIILIHFSVVLKLLGCCQKWWE